MVGQMEASTARAEFPPVEHLSEFARGHPSAAAFAVLGVIALVLLASQGLHDVAQIDPQRPHSGDDLRARRRRPDPRLRNPASWSTSPTATSSPSAPTWPTWSTSPGGCRWSPRSSSRWRRRRCWASSLERVMWRPMRAKGAGLPAADPDVDRPRLPDPLGDPVVLGHRDPHPRRQLTSSVEFLGLRIGQTELIVVIVGLAVLVAVGLISASACSASGCAPSPTTSSSPRPRGSTPVG